VSRFASKAAEEYAEAKSIELPEGFKGSGNNEKVTVKDIKALAEGPKKSKANASPSALQFARDNGLDISRIAQGSGAEGKILLKDVKDLKGPDPKADSDDEDEAPAKISPQAAKLMKQWDIDADDLADIEGTGKDGTVVAKDLKELIDMIKAENDEA
jgi:pyruvate/2-oxoglutarate dehydrogenase complex dihydrolipoamide acyltransferase (E2) component